MPCIPLLEPGNRLYIGGMPDIPLLREQGTVFTIVGCQIIYKMEHGKEVMYIGGMTSNSLLEQGTEDTLLERHAIHNERKTLQNYVTCLRCVPAAIWIAM